MKKYLVIATVLVALVALFSFSASAADMALDANIVYDYDSTNYKVTLDKVAINLTNDATPTAGGYYTVLAYTGNADPADGAATILFAAQETTPITGFNLNPDLLGTEKTLYVKLGGTGLTGTSVATLYKTYAFALIAKNAGGVLALDKYTGNTNEVDADAAITSFEFWGAEIVDAEGLAAAGIVAEEREGGDGMFAVRTQRTLVDLVNNTVESL